MSARELSSQLSDFSYTFGEGRLTLRMTMTLADRVNVVADSAGDLVTPRVPKVAKGKRLSQRFSTTVRA